MQCRLQSRWAAGSNIVFAVDGLSRFDGGYQPGIGRDCSDVSEAMIWWAEGTGDISACSWLSTLRILVTATGAIDTHESWALGRGVAIILNIGVKVRSSEPRFLCGWKTGRGNRLSLQASSTGLTWTQLNLLTFPLQACYFRGYSSL